MQTMHRWTRCKPAAVLLFLLGFAACGSGSGAPSPEILPVDLGLSPLTLPSATSRSFANPLEGAATVTQADQSGPFYVAPVELPAQVDAGASVDLSVIFDPIQPGLALGSITLRFDDGVTTRDVTTAYVAIAEPVSWTVTPAMPDFGVVEIGEQADLSIRVRNDSIFSPVTLSSAVLPAGDYTLVGAPFPTLVPPGGELELTLRFDPQLGGFHEGDLVLGPGDLGGGVSIPVTGSAPGGGEERVVEFGVQPLLDNVTPLLALDVPADAISITFEAYGPPSTALGLDLLSGPGGKVYETPLLTGDYAWVPGMEAFATTLPNSDRPNVQLVPGGGRYEFRIRSYTPGVAALDVRAVIERRPGALTSTGVLPLNVWLANGIAPTAATAAANARLQSILTRVDAILQQQGIVLGDVDYYDVDEPAFDDVTEAEFPYMLKLTAAATETRLNLFFVRTAIGGSTVGAAAAVGGPHRNGTAASGVMSVFDGGPPTLPASVIGLVVAHEIGHYTGLLHTVDSDGTYDIIDDTAECPATGADAICPAEGGGYLMHWQALGGADLTPGQGFVVLRHPSIDPHPLPGPPKPAAKPVGIPSLLDLVELEGLTDGWCATCGRFHTKQGATGTAKR